MIAGQDQQRLDAPIAYVWVHLAHCVGGPLKPFAAFRCLLGGEYFNETGDGKLLLRKALRRYVPEDYANGAKQGFSAPDASWFKGESIEYIKEVLFDKRARIYDYLQPETARSLLQEHFSGTENRRLLIWSLLCFEWWCRIFLDGQYPAANRAN